jgi:hypothetical protein
LNSKKIERALKDDHFFEGAIEVVASRALPSKNQ